MPRSSTDARNDVERIGPFFTVADRVIDIDAKRAKSLAYVRHLSGAEYANAANRNVENAAIVGWVCRSLARARRRPTAMRSSIW